jgi:hypothetical protein
MNSSRDGWQPASVFSRNRSRSSFAGSALRLASLVQGANGRNEFRHTGVALAGNGFHVWVFAERLQQVSRGRQFDIQLDFLHQGTHSCPRKRVGGQQRLAFAEILELFEDDADFVDESLQRLQERRLAARALLQHGQAWPGQVSTYSKGMPFSSRPG